MKVINMPVEVLCWFNKQEMTPLRFRIAKGKDGEPVVVRIDEVFARGTEKAAGYQVYYFDCLATITGKQMPLQLKYISTTAKWVLFKM